MRIPCKNRTEILTPVEMAGADKSCGIPLETLIARAGRAVATEIVRRYGARKTIVLVGPGNKGRDGLAAAEILKGWGWPITISDDVAEAELIIDALYGSGLNRDFPASVANRINSRKVPVVSIDVPSGLDGLTGYPREACIKADLTVTFVRKKPAHVMLPGRDFCGTVVVADIGITGAIVAACNPSIFENAKPVLPVFGSESHKYSRGHAVVVSGPALHTGASRLAASAALRAGAGLVTVVSTSAAITVQIAHLTAVMVAEVNNAGALANLLKDQRKNAVCIGPGAGVGPATKAMVLAALQSGASVVLDADALTSFKTDPAELYDAIGKNPHRAVVLTPHEGEFARIFPQIADLSKVTRARKAASLSGAVVLLKGADTVIARSDGHATVNTHAPPSLATAGSGDVLAGIITGLLAQGMGGYNAACAAAWLHGDAAHRLNQTHITAEDLVESLGK